MKLINIILMIIIYLNQISYENQNLVINEQTKPIILNFFDDIKKIEDFQIGFYVYINDFKNEFVLISFTDFSNLNITIEYKNDNYIYINQHKTNISIGKDIYFFYIKGEIISEFIKLTLWVENNNENNDIKSTSIEYIFNYNLNLKYFNFNMIKPIIGSNKNLLNFKFTGKISYLGGYINEKMKKSSELKNVNSKLVVFHLFTKILNSKNFIENSLKNGFSGSLNSYKNNIGVRLFYSAYSNVYKRYAFFNQYDSAISLSKDFIQYLSKFEKKIYSVYLSLKFKPSNSFSLNNVNKVNFYFYKRNNLSFYDEIDLNVKNKHGFKIYSSTKEEYTGISVGETVFESIFIKINNINNNKYLVTYEYNTNKNNLLEYNNFNVSRVEYLNFNENDNHIVGFINEKYDNNLIKLQFYINIYELALMLGSNFYNKNIKLYTKNENELFLLSCNSKTNIFKNRNNSDENICIENNNYFPFKIANCIEIKDNKCIKCTDNVILKNGKCYSLNFINSNYSKKRNYINNNYLKKHEFEIVLSEKSKLYEFYCKFNSRNSMKITIKINNLERKMNYTLNESKILRNFYITLFLKKNVKVSFESNHLFNYNCIFYEFLGFKEDKINFKSDEFLYQYKNFFLSYYNSDLIINKDIIPSNYFISLDKKAIPCPYNCSKCDSPIKCYACEENYQLWDGICVYISNKTKYLINKINNRENKNDQIILNETCFNGCNSCNSPLYNECLDCKSGYLYYPGLKQCVKSNNCYENYFLYNNTCLSLCKKYNSLYQCISCNNMLNLNKRLNKCIRCNNDNSYFKNFEILDFDNKPTCNKCNKNCKTCSGSKNNCTSCHQNKLIIIDKFLCTDNCPKGYYKNKNKCLKCKSDCLNCINNKCLKCSEGKYIKNDLCVNNCGEKYFLNNNKCIKCDKYCLTCNKSSTCLICMQGFYLNNKNKCVRCNLPNQFIKKNTCITCSNNCKSCLNNKNNCLTCNKGFKLIIRQDLSFCIKQCDSNNYFDLENKICINCNKCDKCYENNKALCYNCPKCKNMCKLDVFYDDFGIHIETNKKNGIIFDKNYKIKNFKTKNIIGDNNIKLWFKNNKNNFKLNLSNNIIKSSKNCLNIFQSNFTLSKIKTKCFIKKSILYNFDNKLTLQLETNIIYEDNWKLNFYIKSNKRLIQYKIKTINYINNISFLLVDLYPNYYTSKYDITMILSKKYMNIHSPCNLIDITKNYKVINHKNKIFKPDYMMYKEDIKKFYNNKILKNLKNINNQYKNILKSSSLIVIIINIFHTGNLLPLLSIIQLVYFLELILLLPINLGDNINTFINYLKLDLDNELNVNFIFNIQNNNEIKKYFEDKFYVNPKISDINWINIWNFQIDIIMIILLYLFHFILLIIKKILIKINPDNNKYSIKLLNTLIINTKIIRFKIIEAFKIIIISILVVYLTNINKFKFNLDNIKIFLIVFFYYIIWCHYFWDHINSLIYINFSNKNNFEKKNSYYNNIITFAFNNSKLNTCYQMINSLREFLFIIIIFILKNLKIHSILFLIIQVLFIIYIFLLSKKNYFMVQKIKFEEIINLILILSWILNHSFKYEQFQIWFIILYLLLFGLNLFIMCFNLIYYFFKVLNFQMKQIWILTKNKISIK